MKKGYAQAQTEDHQPQQRRMSITHTASTAPHANLQDPKVILRRLDGTRFVLPRRPELGILTGRADMENEMLSLLDAQGRFIGCYLSCQLPYIGFERFDSYIRIVS